MFSIQGEDDSQTNIPYIMHILLSLMMIKNKMLVDITLPADYVIVVITEDLEISTSGI